MEIYIILLFSVLTIVIVSTVVYNVVKTCRKTFRDELKRLKISNKFIEQKRKEQKPVQYKTDDIIKKPDIKPPQAIITEEQTKDIISVDNIEQPIPQQPVIITEPTDTQDRLQYASDIRQDKDKPLYYEPSDYDQYSVAINPQIQASLNALSNKYAMDEEPTIEHFDPEDCKPFKCNCVDDEYLVKCFANLVDDINKWKIYSDKVLYVNSVVPSYGYDRLVDNVCNCIKNDHDINYKDRSDAYNKIDKKLKDLEKALEFKTNRATICKANKKNCTNSETNLQYSDNDGKELFTSSDDNKVVTSYDIINEMYKTKLNNGKIIIYEPFNNNPSIQQLNKYQAEEHLTNILKLIHDKYIALSNV